MTTNLSLRTTATLLVLLSFTAPSVLNSADIYVSSAGAVRIEAILNSNVVTGDPRLESTVLLVSTPSDASSVNLDIPCEHSDTLVSRTTGKENRSIFLIRSTIRSSCENASIRVSIDGKVFTDTQRPLSVVTASDIVRDLSDYPSDLLTETMRDDFDRSGILSKNLEASSSGLTVEEKLSRIRDHYRVALLTKRSDIARMILDERASLKYISPVAGYEIPRADRLSPGTGRPYRKATTDGIHHGWDILAPYGTPVRALWKGVVIRVVSDWQWSDFDRIKQRHLTDDDRLTNLDIYRGNQVWIKTLDGNVAFYSHLSRIDTGIVPGTLVDAGMPLGAIGKSGVPDRNYRDIHLHLEIQKNPHIPGNEPLTPLDIMRWEYVGKGESRGQVQADTQSLFY